MTSSELCAEGERVLDRIMGLLQEDHIRRLIDGPLEEAAKRFVCAERHPMTTEAFNRMVSAFVRHLCQCGCRPARYVSSWEALSEAVSLLEPYSNSPDWTGYEAALFDATQAAPECPERILDTIQESFKARRREAHRKWVFATNLAPSAWGLRCEVVAAFLARRKRFFPDNILRHSPSRLADSYEMLIDDDLGRKCMLGSTSLSQGLPITAETIAGDLPLPW